MILRPAAFEVFAHHLAALAEGAFYHSGERLMQSIGVERIGTPVESEAGGVHAGFGKETVRRNFKNFLHLIPAGDEQGEFAVFLQDTACIGFVKEERTTSRSAVRYMI